MIECCELCLWWCASIPQLWSDKMYTASHSIICVCIHVLVPASKQASIASSPSPSRLVSKSAPTCIHTTESPLVFSSPCLTIVIGQLLCMLYTVYTHHAAYHWPHRRQCPLPPVTTAPSLGRVAARRVTPSEVAPWPGTCPPWLAHSTRPSEGQCWGDGLCWERVN